MKTRFYLPAITLLLIAILGLGGARGQDEPATRMFVDDFGHEVEIPAEPQRVVTLQDQHALFTLWQLGFRNIVGSACATDGSGKPYFRRMAAHGFEATSVECIGIYGEPDLEKILALRPDLIVGTWGDEEIYDQLSRIAPTVVLNPWDDAPLYDIVMRYATLVGREDAVHELKAEYEENLARLREMVGDPSEIVVLTIMTAASGGAEPGQFFIPAGTIADVLREVGFARPAVQLQQEGRQYYSVEQIRNHDADLLIRITTAQAADQEEANTRAVLESPLWQQLNAVQKGQAVDVDGEATVGGGYLPYIAFTRVLMELIDGLDTSGDLSHVEVATPDGQ